MKLKIKIASKVILLFSFVLSRILAVGQNVDLNTIMKYWIYKDGYKINSKYIDTIFVICNETPRVFKIGMSDTNQRFRLVPLHRKEIEAQLKQTKSLTYCNFDVIEMCALNSKISVSLFSTNRRKYKSGLTILEGEALFTIEYDSCNYKISIAGSMQDK